MSKSIWGFAFVTAIALVGLLFAPVAVAPKPAPCPGATSGGNAGTMSTGGEILAPCPSGPVRLTFLGTTSNEYAEQVAFDAGGNLIVALTSDAGLPTTAGAYDTTFNGAADVWVGRFDANLTTLLFGTWLGGLLDDSVWGLSLDPAGNIYLTGTTGGGFPVTAGAYDTTHNGFSDVFLAILNPSGTSLTYSTYLGGSGSSGDTPFGNPAVEVSGDVYLTGVTYSIDFPTTLGAFDSTLGGSADAFVARIRPASTGAADLIYSTYLGGSTVEKGRAISVDAGGNAYAVGFTDSTDFPTTTGAFDPSKNGQLDAFLTKLNPTGSALVYSSYLGGSGEDSAWAVGVDALGQAFVGGKTASSNFPVTMGSFDTSKSLTDAFLLKMNSAGSALLYSTFLGGKSGVEIVRDLVVADDGSVMATGETGSSNFPLTPDGYDISYNGGISDAFLVRLNPAGNALSYSTFLGGSAADEGYGVALSDGGMTAVGGFTQSSNFPTSSGAYDTSYNGGWDGFLATLV